MHAHYKKIDVEEVIKNGPLPVRFGSKWLLTTMISIGVVTFFYLLIDGYSRKSLWGAYYVNLLFWMGLSAGGVITAAIFQIVRAKWSPPIRRIAEANVAFLPFAYIGLLATYFGKDVLFPWATAPMPGREWWMQPNFVYMRMAILFALMFYLFYKYVNWSLKGDIAVSRQIAKEKWQGLPYLRLVKDWQGECEIKKLQVKMSRLAPILVVIYAVVYTLFATEMIVGMDTVWFSNMFGGFEFLGNIYIAWAFIAIVAIYLDKKYPQYSKVLTTRQTWDLGMLCFGFCMLWAYTFFAQFLPQWYGNMPEETQWLILRTREFPWKGVAWGTFSMAFVIPFVLLLSEDVKKTPWSMTLISFIIMVGVWLERYVIVMPQLFPDVIPFGIAEIGLAIGFAGVYLWSVQSFLSKYPYVPVSHPLTKGSRDW